MGRFGMKAVILRPLRTGPVRGLAIIRDAALRQVEYPYPGDTCVLKNPSPGAGPVNSLGINSFSVHCDP
jgi:hypothetical protein